MAPALTVANDQSRNENTAAKVAAQVQARPTSILHRTPWRPPVARSAKGIYVELEDGRTIIDAVGGASVACIGNGHPKVVQAIKDQVDKVSYVYNMQLSNEPAEALAKRLVDSGKGAFAACGFVSGGSEAMEAVIKLAHQYFYETKQTERVNFIARQLSFHGNTLGTLSLAHHPTRRAAYEPILNHTVFHHVSPAYAKRFQKPDESEEQYVERLRQELDDKFQELGPNTVVAFVAETVVGATTGVVPPPKGYLKAMKSVCDKYGALFILDEVMSGMGRMGTTHAWETYDGVTPDIQAVAKGLGGGYASIGAVLMSEKVAQAVRGNSGAWQHGHTYQAHPIACAASLAVQDVIQEENLLERCRSNGEKLSALLHSQLLSPNSLAAPFVYDIRGKGSFWGIEFDFNNEAASSYDFGGKKFAGLVQSECLEQGIVIMGLSGGANVKGTAGDHCILSPAYNASESEIERIVELFVKSVETTLNKHRR